MSSPTYVWNGPPRWDDKQRRYYFEGSIFPGSPNSRPKKRWLKDYELEANGEPRPNIDPNASVPRTGLEEGIQNINLSDGGQYIAQNPGQPSNFPYNPSTALQGQSPQSPPTFYTHTAQTVAQNQVRDNTASRFTSQLYAGASPATVGTIQPGGSDVWQIDQQYSANYRHGGASTSHMSPGQAPGTGLSGIAFITDSNEQIQPSASGTNLGGFDGTTLLNYTILPEHRNDLNEPDAEETKHSTMNYNASKSKGKSKSKTMGKNRAMGTSNTASMGMNMNDTNSNVIYDEETGMSFDLNGMPYTGTYSKQGPQVPASSVNQLDRLKDTVNDQAWPSYGDEKINAAAFEAKEFMYGGGQGESSKKGLQTCGKLDRSISQLPRQSIHVNIGRSNNTPQIRGTSGNSEVLDPRYRIQPSRKFQAGQVFKVMWSEPRGGISRTTLTLEPVPVLYKTHRNDVWVGIRRFIVIRNDEGHCTCVPIYTYGNQGCGKYGVKGYQHGIIYEKDNSPIMMANEPKLGFDPIRIETITGEYIAPASRVDYSKLVTVQHNVKVLFIGEILIEDWEIVEGSVNATWNAKKPRQT